MKVTVGSVLNLVHKKALAVISISAALLASTSSAESATLDHDAGGNPRALLATAQFRFYVPDNEKVLRGTMILIPGRDQDGRGMADDARWKQLAGELKLALLACHFKGTDRNYQNDPTGDGSKLIDSAIEKFAKDSGHPELVKSPVALWGHSAGSNFGAIYSSRNPRRVAAAVSLKGPVGAGNEMPAGREDVPYLVIVGKNDNAEWVKSAVENYEKARGGRAIWALALNKNEGHEAGNTKDLTFAFLKGAITQRLGAVTPTSGGFSGFSTAGSGSASGKALKSADDKTAWLGNLETYEISPFGQFKGDKRKAAWLPDESAAKAWQAYLK